MSKLDLSNALRLKKSILYFSNELYNKELSLNKKRKLSNKIELQSKQLGMQIEMLQQEVKDRLSISKEIDKVIKLGEIDG
jgi:hypothetical protein